MTVFERSDSPAPGGPAGAAGRYELYGEIGRGGMGEVWRGRDPSLGRDLALKVLLAKHAARPEVVRRFLEEAQINGQLQHPGVVPVYELGRYDDGRPFFTMKLVKGRTLAALLKERPSAAHDLPRFLGVFEAVCQAVGYAHSKGVIHRDLKPANVMVGAFGEVQVMDWGLAKVLGSPRGGPPPGEGPAGSVVQTDRSGGAGAESRPGSVMGTPAYMAPEQALGQVERLDRRCDVFGLGAILCEVLTGRPPYVAADAESSLRKAARADLADAFARLAGCGADAELVALAKACLAPEPQGRPADAAAVADAVAAHRAGVEERLRRAELERAQAQVKAAEERKRRKLVAGLAAALLLLVAGGGGGAWWEQRQSAERAAEALRLRGAVAAALDKAGALRQQARWAAARAVLEQTRDLLGRAGPEDLRGRVERATADLALVGDLEAIRLKRSTWAEGRFDNRTADRDYEAAFRRAGLGAVGEEPEAVGARLRASAVAEQLVAAADDWAAATDDAQRRAWLLEVARRADPDEWRDRYRDPAVWLDRARLEELTRELLADERQLARQSPPLLAGLGGSLLREKLDAVPLLEAAQARSPDDFWLNFALGQAFFEAKKWEAAVGFYRSAVALRPSVAAARNNLGNALYATGRRDEAVREYRKAVELGPEMAQPHNGLGNALRDRGLLDEALGEYRAAIELDPKLAPPRCNLGGVLRRQGRLEEAGREYRTAAELDPQDALARNGLGNVFYSQGHLDEAAREYRTAIDLDPNAAEPHNGLGTVLHARRQLEEAIREYRTAIELGPKDASPHNNLGLALRDKGLSDEAIREFHQAIALDPKFAAAHSNLGIALRERGRLEEALRELRTAITLDPKDAAAHNALGLALRDKGMFEEAIREYRTAAALGPKDANPHLNLGNVLNGKGQLEEAVREFRAAIALDPKAAKPHIALGLTLAAKGRLDEATGEFRKAVELGPKSALAHHSLGTALIRKGRPDEAIREYRAALELDPKYAAAHDGLGLAFHAKGRLDEAIDEFRKAVELGPENATAHFNLGIALRDGGRRDEAIREFRVAVELGPKLTPPRSALAESLFNLGRFAEAREATRRWLDVLPGNDPSRPRALRRLQLCDLFITVDQKLAPILAGREAPADDAERIALAELCQQPFRKRYAASARFFAEAFAHDPKLAADLQQQHRYHAACAAAQASAGHGEDARSLPDKVAAGLRRQALGWLKAELTDYARLTERGDAATKQEIGKRLARWRQGPDLAPVRDRAALGRLPEAERQAWRQLWADVGALLKKVADAGSP